MSHEIDISTLKEQYLSKDLNIIDVREEDEYQTGHIPRSVNMPLSTLAENIDKFDADEEYLIICRTDRRSALASQELREKGFNATTVLGGVSAWDGEIEKD